MQSTAPAPSESQEHDTQQESTQISKAPSFDVNIEYIFKRLAVIASTLHFQTPAAKEPPQDATKRAEAAERIEKRKDLPLIVDPAVDNPLLDVIAHCYASLTAALDSGTFGEAKTCMNTLRSETAKIGNPELDATVTEITKLTSMFPQLRLTAKEMEDKLKAKK